MFSWFKRNSYPEFWKSYLALFKGPQSASFEKARFVVFDTETTGLDTSKDKILSIGAVSLVNDVLDISDSFELFLKQTKYDVSTVEIHGILKNGRYQKVSEKKAIEAFIKYIGNSVLVAHHAAFDVAIINTALKNMKLGKLKNKVVDTGVLYKKLKGVEQKHYSLDDLASQFKIAMHDRHTSAGDALITALLLIKTLKKIKKERHLAFEDLFINRNADGGLI